MSRLCAPALLALALSFGGCANLAAPPYTPDYPAVDALKRTGADKVAVAPLQPRDPAAAVNRISLRGSPLVVPSGSFARYVEDALVQDLREAGLLDPASPLRIEATLLRNELDVSGIQTGRGEIEMDLAVRRGETLRLQKRYRASTRFESSFAGAIAIPKGQLEYANLVKALLLQVYSDPEFINALKKKD